MVPHSTTNNYTWISDTVAELTIYTYINPFIRCFQGAVSVSQQGRIVLSMPLVPPTSGNLCDVYVIITERDIRLLCWSKLKRVCAYSIYSNVIFRKIVDWSQR